MKAYDRLPEGYSELFAIDLQKDKRLALLVILLAVAIGVLLAVPMHFLVPISTLFRMDGGIGPYLLRFGVLLLSTVLYMILHELVHGAAMKLCGTRRVKYGFTGLYAFAGSGDYYTKGAYLFIALSPVVLFGVLLAALLPFVPAPWFWVVYFIEIFNLSGAAGDLYVTARFVRLPRTVLVHDHGVGMQVFSRE